MINVCLFCNDLAFGGAQRQLVELALGLDKSQFKVLVVTLESDFPLEEELRGQEGIVFETLNRRNKFDITPLFGLVRLLRSHEIHIIQPFLTPSTLYGLAASFLSRVPIRIVTERCGLRNDRRLGNKIYRYVEDRMTRFADLAVANSEAGRQYLHSRRIDPGMTRVIYNGINQDRLQADPEQVRAIRECLNVPSDGFVIGNVAGLTVPKDQATILRAAASLLPEYPGLRVALVGDGPLRGELEGLAQELGVGSNVVFFGNHLQVGDYIGAFDVAVLSSVDNEGCSNFILEAMGLGKPVIASDVGGNNELVRPDENGWLFGPADPVGLASALRAAITDPKLCADMGSQGKQMVATRFSLSGMVDAQANLYKELVKEKIGVSPSEKRIVA